MSSKGNNGAEAALREYRKFHTPDDREFEAQYFGPSGSGLGGKAVGCKPFFDQLRSPDIGKGNKLLRYAKALDNHNGGEKEASEEAREASAVNDCLVDLITKLSVAIESPE